MKAAQPVAVTAAGNAAGAVEGKIVTIEVAVTNGSKQPINDAIMGAPEVTYGAEGTAAANAVDAQAGIGMATFSGIRPGETRTVKLGYGIPAAGFADVRMVVQPPNFDAAPPVIFKGAIKTQ